MKKIYLSLIAVGLFALTANAQNGQDTQHVMPQLQTGEIVHPKPTRIGSATNAHREAGDTVWFDGFEDPSNWEFIAPTMDLDPTVNGWSIGNTNNSWVNFAAMNTEGNYARFVNGDPFEEPPTTVEEEPFIFLYTGTIPDLTGVPAPQLVFDQYGGRFLTHQAIQISTDGGTEWQTVGSNDDIQAWTDVAGGPYPNPQTRSFLLSNFIADDPSNVMVRFIWEAGVNGGQPSFVEYAWFVDNVRIEEGAPDDVILSDVQYGKYDYDSENVEEQLWDDQEYGIYDVNQVRPLILNANIFNNGANEQTNVQLVVTVSNTGGELETVSSDPATIAPGEEVYFELEYTPPAEVGEYTLLYNASIEGEDANPEDNMGELTFQIADGVFSRDNGEIANLSSIILEAGAEAGAGLGYYFTEDAEVHCIGAVIGEGSFEEVEFTGFVHEAIGPDYPSLENTQSEVVANAVLNDIGDDPVFTWLYMLEFDPFGAGEEEIAPFSVSADDEWVFSFQWTPIAIDGDPDDIGGLFIGTSSNLPLDEGSMFLWGPPASEGICEPCGIGFTASYMIRLGLSQEFCESVVTVGLEEIDNVEVQELYPNPTDGQTTLSYALLESADVQIFLFDIHGRIVMNQDLGTQGVGEYRYDYNWSDQAAGMYTLSIHVNDKAVNKKLVIK